MSNSIDINTSQFGNYLRYWRSAKNVSQEDLAGLLDCSVKHISFMENGRTQPSQAIILRLGQTLSLAKIDINNLLISAGFRPERGLLENSPDEKDHFDKTLSLMLQSVEASPALIRDRFGNIVMMNKACVVLWREWLGDALNDPGLMNTYRLFFSERGWRPFVENWPAIAMLMLLSLHQERLLLPDAQADELIDELACIDGVLKGWDKIDSIYTKRPYFNISIVHPDSQERWETLVCTNVIGNLSQNVASSLILEIHCNLDGELPYSAADIAAMGGVEHPLLPY